MKPILKTQLLLCLVVSLLFSGCSKSDYQTATGDKGSFADAHGKWLLINYWAQWCKPCVEEMPELNRFQQQHKDQVVLLAVNYDGAQGDSLQQQIAKLKIEFPVLLADPAQLLGYQRPDALPTTLVFDPQGKLRQTLQGPQTVASLTAVISSTAASVENEP
ncbi:MAG TPA: TlpA disulfide reductase family protein [Spongiibacteraceae bacterium]|jgi:thiol-disulfide isomerase/thioredoxin